MVLYYKLYGVISIFQDIPGVSNNFINDFGTFHLTVFKSKDI